MTRRTDPFWRLLADRPRTTGTLTDWRGLLGDAFDLVRPVLKPTGDYARAWVCGDSGKVGCYREVHDHGNQVVAVCGEQPRRCERITLRRDDLVLYAVDPRRLGRSLLTGVTELEDEHTPMERGWFLGTARFGGEPIALHLGFVAEAGALLSVRRALQDRWPDRRVVLLVPMAEQVDAAARAALEGMGGIVLALDESLHDTGTLAADLADVVTHFRFAGVDLGSLLAHRYDLILDPLGNRYWLYGEPIAFKKRARFPQRLLAALAGTPSALVTRLDLFGAVWPDDYGRKGVEKNWARSLRDQVTALKEALAVDEGRYPVVAHPSGDDADGGYSLRLDPRRVHWWSEPIE